MFRAFITNKMITLVHHSKVYRNKTYPSNGDYQYYYLTIKIMYAEGTVGKYKKSLQPKITYYIRNVMQRTVHVTDVLIQSIPSVINNSITPLFLENYTLVIKMFFQKIIILYIAFPYQSLLIFISTISHKSYLFYIDICAIFITN